MEWRFQALLNKCEEVTGGFHRMVKICCQAIFEKDIPILLWMLGAAPTSFWMAERRTRSVPRDPSGQHHMCLRFRLWQEPRKVSGMIIIKHITLTRNGGLGAGGFCKKP